MTLEPACRLPTYVLNAKRLRMREVFLALSPACARIENPRATVLERSGAGGLKERANRHLSAPVSNLHHCNIANYIDTMPRLMTRPVSTVDAGHEPSFGRDRLHEIAQAQLARWDALRQARVAGDAWT